MKKIGIILLVILFLLGCSESGVNDLDNAYYGTNPNCTQIKNGNLIISDFYFNSSKIQLSLKNISEEQITITGFTGSPINIEWEKNLSENNNPEIAPNNAYYAVLTGSFPQNMNEEITISFTVNGESQTDKTTCTGPTST